MEHAHLFALKSKVVDTINFPVPSGVWLTGASTLWSSGVTGKGCKVGIIDTGIDSTHPDLKGKVINKRDYVKDGVGETFYNMHGTHVAGTIGANGKIKGVAPECSLLDYRVLDRRGYGTVEGVVGGIYDSVRDGCNVINLSLGVDSSINSLKTAIQFAISKGVLVVAAAGNSGPNTMSYPACYNGVVSVGAIEYDVNTNKITLPTTPWFSSSNKYVSIACDGWQVLSTTPGNRYNYISGTSMASPHATGIAALLFSKTQKQSYSTLYNSILSSTIDILQPGRDDISGKGLLTLYKSLPVYNVLKK